MRPQDGEASGLAPEVLHYQNVNRDADDSAQLRVARVASIAFAAVIFVGTVWALGNVGFLTLLLVSGIGATALAGPFALSLFWEKTSTNGFVAGVIVSQLVTGYLLLGNGGLPLWTDLKLWEIMVVGHALSTGVTAIGSLLSPDEFDFESIAREDVATDGGDAK